MSQPEIPLANIPLAARMRPTCLDEFVGQSHLLGAGKPLARLANLGQIASMIFWGPPGTGKTTLARIYLVNFRQVFLNFLLYLAD